MFNNMNESVVGFICSIMSVIVYGQPFYKNRRTNRRIIGWGVHTL